MALILRVISGLISAEIFALIARIIFEYIRMFSRQWKPRGFMLVVAEIVYTVTDPLVRTARRLIPSLKLGSVAIDISVLALFVLLQVARALVDRLANSL